MSKKPRIVLHLGPHKMATTYLQVTLKQNQAALNEQGIKFIPLGQLRQLLTPSLSMAPHELPDLEDVLGHWLKCETLVLFEENFIGGVEPPKDGQLYSGLPKRMANLAKLLRGHEIKLHLILRGMVDYLPSRYSEHLRHGRFKSFEEYYAEIPLSAISWEPMVKQIHAAFGLPVHISLLGDVVSKPEDYLRRLTNSDVQFVMDNDSSDPSVRRSKISSEIYHILSETARVFSGAATKQVLKALEQLESEKPKTDFRPLNQQQVEMLDRNYKQDLAEFRRSVYAVLENS